VAKPHQIDNRPSGIVNPHGFAGRGLNGGEAKLESLDVKRNTSVAG
jgi:hypothetical protein